MKMSEQQIVAYNFKRLREDRGWTQEQLAAMHKVSQNYIAQIEGNHCDFGVRARKKWASKFGVDISEFFQMPKDADSGSVECNTIVEKINRMIQDMDETAQRDVLKYAEEKKLISGLRRKKVG